MKKLKDENLSEEERAKATHKIAELQVTASENNAWWYGPLNERKKIKVEDTSPRPLPLPEIDEEPVRDPNEPPETNDLDAERSPDADTDIDLDTIPKVEELELRKDKDEVTGNTLQRLLKRAGRYLKGETKDFQEYLPGKRGEIWAIGVAAGAAGLTSVMTGAYAAEIAMASMVALPALMGPVGLVTGVAVAGIVNFGFAKSFEGWAKQKSGEELNHYKPETDGELKDFNEKVGKDYKGRIRAFAIADIVAKIAGGFGLSHLPTPHGAEASAATPGHPLPDNTPDFNPLQAGGHAGLHEAIKNGALTKEVGNFAKHVVTDKDTWSSLLGEKVVYSPKFLDVLKENHDSIMQMFTHWAATNGHHGVPIETGADAHMEYRSVADVQKLLDGVIKDGYPSQELAKQDYGEYVRRLGNMERIGKWLLPGTVLELPTP